MAVLTALKVRIGLEPNGHAAYPDFNQLPSVRASGLDWSTYVDRHGSGWCYDKTSGHREESPDSPHGQQWGMVLVPDAFAREADAAFPMDVEILTEVEAEAFWDTKGHAHLDDVKRDVSVLTALKAERDLVVAVGGSTANLDAKIARAHDPDDPMPGIRRLRQKRFADYKTESGATITSVTAKRRIGEVR